MENFVENKLAEDNKSIENQKKVIRELLCTTNYTILITNLKLFHQINLNNKDEIYYEVLKYFYDQIFKKDIKINYIREIILYIKKYIIFYYSKDATYVDYKEIYYFIFNFLKYNIKDGFIDLFKEIINVYEFILCKNYFEICELIKLFLPFLKNNLILILNLLPVKHLSLEDFEDFYEKYLFINFVNEKDTKLFFKLITKNNIFVKSKYLDKILNKFTWDINNIKNNNFKSSNLIKNILIHEKNNEILNDKIFCFINNYFESLKNIVINFEISKIYDIVKLFEKFFKFLIENDSNLPLLNIVKNSLYDIFPYWLIKCEHKKIKSIFIDMVNFQSNFLVRLYNYYIEILNKGNLKIFYLIEYLYIILNLLEENNMINEVNKLIKQFVDKFNIIDTKYKFKMVKNLLIFYNYSKKIKFNKKILDLLFSLNYEKIKNSKIILDLVLNNSNNNLSFELDNYINKCSYDMGNKCIINKLITYIINNNLKYDMNLYITSINFRIDNNFNRDLNLDFWIKSDKIYDIDLSSCKNNLFKIILSIKNWNLLNKTSKSIIKNWIVSLLLKSKSEYGIILWNNYLKMKNLKKYDYYKLFINKILKYFKDNNFKIEKNNIKSLDLFNYVFINNEIPNNKFTIIYRKLLLIVISIFKKKDFIKWIIYSNNLSYLNIFSDLIYLIIYNLNEENNLIYRYNKTLLLIIDTFKLVLKNKNYYNLRSYFKYQLALKYNYFDEYLNYNFNKNCKLIDLTNKFYNNDFTYFIKKSIINLIILDSFNDYSNNKYFKFLINLYFIKEDCDLINFIIEEINSLNDIYNNTDSFIIRNIGILMENLTYKNQVIDFNKFYLFYNKILDNNILNYSNKMEFIVTIIKLINKNQFKNLDINLLINNISNFNNLLNITNLMMLNRYLTINNIDLNTFNIIWKKISEKENNFQININLIWIIEILKNYLKTKKINNKVYILENPLDILNLKNKFNLITNDNNIIEKNLINDNFSIKKIFNYRYLIFQNDYNLPEELNIISINLYSKLIKIINNFENKMDMELDLIFSKFIKEFFNLEIKFTKIFLYKSLYKISNIILSNNLYSELHSNINKIELPKNISYYDIFNDFSKYKYLDNNQKKKIIENYYSCYKNPNAIKSNQFLIYSLNHINKFKYFPYCRINDLLSDLENKNWFYIIPIIPIIDLVDINYLDKFEILINKFENNINNIKVLNIFIKYLIINSDKNYKFIDYNNKKLIEYNKLNDKIIMIINKIEINENNLYLVIQIFSIFKELKNNNYNYFLFFLIKFCKFINDFKQYNTIKKEIEEGVEKFNFPILNKNNLALINNQIISIISSSKNNNMIQIVITIIFKIIKSNNQELANYFDLFLKLTLMNNEIINSCIINQMDKYINYITIDILMKVFDNFISKINIHNWFLFGTFILKENIDYSNIIKFLKSINVEKINKYNKLKLKEIVNLFNKKRLSKIIVFDKNTTDINEVWTIIKDMDIYANNYFS